MAADLVFLMFACVQLTSSSESSTDFIHSFVLVLFDVISVALVSIIVVSGIAAVLRGTCKTVKIVVSAVVLTTVFLTAAKLRKTLIEINQTVAYLEGPTGRKMKQVKSTCKKQ